MRRVLPQRRASETFELRQGTSAFKVTIGYYPEGIVGEVFITGPKIGSEMEAIARDAAVILSIAVQHGVPLDVIRHAITREGNSAPSSIIGRVVDRLTIEEIPF